MKSDPKILLQQAEILISEGHMEVAIARLNKLLELQPSLVAAHTMLGGALQQIGRIPEAINEYRHALDLDAHNSEISYQIGLMLESEGQYEEAISIYQQSFGMEADPWLYHRIALCLHMRGRSNEALAEYSKAILLDAENAEWQLNLGAILADIDRKEDAVIAFHAALQLEPDHSVALYNLAVTLEELDKLEEARTIFHQLILILRNDNITSNHEHNALYLSSARSHLASLTKQIEGKPTCL